jgi:uncharacterized membrane protein
MLLLLLLHLLACVICSWGMFKKSVLAAPTSATACAHPCKRSSE